MLEDITLGQLLAAITFITTFCGAIWLALKPVRTLNGRLEGIEKRLEAVETHLDNDNRKLRQFDEDLKIVFKNQLLVIDHDIHGNHDKELRIAIEDTKNHIIQR